MSVQGVEKNRAGLHLVEKSKRPPGSAEVISLPSPEIDDPTPERVHGKFPRAELFSNQLVKMSQIRGEQNTVKEQLKDEIAGSIGLLNSIDVAHLSEETLEEYISFVNGVWGSESKLEDFLEQRQEDGTYYLIIAGHSRHQAITELEDEGRIHRYPLEVKLHVVETPQQIIAIQLSENVHSTPPRERRAIAIVETYQWGILNGLWANQKEFLEQNEDIGKTVLSEALAFTNVPPHIRNFVLAGHMSYNAGLEIGKAAEDLKDYLLFKSGLTEETASVDQLVEIAGLLDIELTIETNKVINKRLNSTAAEKAIRAWRGRMVEEMTLDAEARAKADENAMFALELVSADEILREERKNARARMAEYIRDYSRAPSSSAQELILLNRAVVPPELIEKALRDHRESAEKAARILAVGSLHSNDVLELIKS